MSSAIAVSVGGSLIGGMMSSDASSEAADTQAAAATSAAQLTAQTTREQMAQQLAMYNQNVARLQPWVSTGTAASNQLANLMGLRVTPTITQNEANFDANAWMAANPTLAAQIGVKTAGTAGTGQASQIYQQLLSQKDESFFAGPDSSLTTWNQNDESNLLYYKSLAEREGYSEGTSPKYGSAYEAYLANPNSGYTATAAAQQAAQASQGTSSDFGSLTKNFGSGDLGLDPSYQFRLQQGNQALAASAAARGGLLTGQGAKDISDYNQNAASQEYQAAYNRYVTNQTNLYNRLTGLSNTGENAAAQVGNTGTQVSSNIANTASTGTAAQNAYLNQGAAASAAGTIGASNAWGSAINSGLQNYQYLSNLNGTTSQYAPGTQAAAPVVNKSTYYSE